MLDTNKETDFRWRYVIENRKPMGVRKEEKRNLGYKQHICSFYITEVQRVQCFSKSMWYIYKKVQL